MKFTAISHPALASRIQAKRTSGGDVYIYALVDPDDSTVRYIGKTSYPRRRLVEHVKARQRNYGLVAWVRALTKIGKAPLMWMLQTTTRERWQAAEKAWIRLARRHGDLFNIEDGGEGEQVGRTRLSDPPTETASLSPVATQLTSRYYARCRTKVAEERSWDDAWK